MATNRLPKSVVIAAARNIDAPSIRSVDHGSYEISEPRHYCFACTAPSSHMRRDASGEIHRSCADHQRDLEIMVREINEWNGDNHATA